MMTFEKIRTILSEQLSVEEDEITLSSNIIDDLGADSLDLVDMAMTVEDEFGIELPEEMLEKVQTVEDVINYIDSI
ncbi:MAG: acyl carrier protein [Clostridia bacterium]|nr:acyl carrier protein [Clostridia bacterium]